ncbi:exosortase-associated protein EpsI, B-type [Rhodoferax sp.]|uniref:exosortase-associated protein EpsI, B-type n=1 Tax=Rhodoferax sp. TaxID=50421 RepID=UPI0026082356|nr:exosortase-associated protein EpsI, B-type [Rhodoferax sp.]MDD2808409.1 EpsI family protein [Rhodoferax sp.]MDD4942915.1 EpsI family protein [Rhodoferax sp.]
MSTAIKKWILLVLMLAAGVAAHIVRPTVYLSDLRPQVDLENLIPKQFGEWRQLEQSGSQIINPQQSQLLKKFYSQTLARSYVNADGKVIMLSIAYGANQSDGVALHYPEVCYPAQGFQLLAKVPATLTTDFGDIAAKQLMTRLGNRNEPVTYWSTLGDKVVPGGIRTKLAQMDYGFKGFIPDGLIFRVSSIDRDADKAHDDQALFVKDLMNALPAPSRLRLAGLAR